MPTSQRIISTLCCLVLVLTWLSPIAKSEEGPNAEEREIGLRLAEARPGLQWHPTVALVARRKAEDMAQRNYFAHVDPEGLGINHYLRLAGYPLPAYPGEGPSSNNYESLGAGSTSAQQTWQMWLGSPPHRTHILGENAFFAQHRYYGVGYAYSPNSRYQHYWVVLTTPAY